MSHHEESEAEYAAFDQIGEDRGSPVESGRASAVSVCPECHGRGSGTSFEGCPSCGRINPAEPIPAELVSWLVGKQIAEAQYIANDDLALRFTDGSECVISGVGDEPLPGVLVMWEDAQAVKREAL